MDSAYTWSFLMFGAILLVLMLVRWKWRRIEVKPGDLAAAALPVVVLLMAQGKIQSFQFGDLKVEAAIREAATAAIAGQVAAVSTLPVDAVETAAKGGSSDLQRLRSKRVEGLAFTVGENRYVGAAIRDYLRALPTLRHVVLQRPDGTLFGIADAAKLTLAIATGEAPGPADEFAGALNRGNKEPLEHLPGFIPAAAAVQDRADKSAVLAQMEKQNVDVLPVVNDRGQFAGVVNRSRLVASVLVDVAARIK